jgi:replicative DNA helicase
VLDNQDFSLSGRLQPQARELEEAVLGAFLLDSEAYPLVSGILSPEMFYENANKAVFRAIQTLSDKRQPIDLLTVFEALKRSGELEAAGGAHRLSQLTANIASGAHVEYHARIIAQKHLARRLIVITHEVQQRAFDETEDVEDIMQLLETKFTELSVRRTSAESIPMDKAVHEAITKAAQRQQERQKGISTSIPTGINNLTRAFYGGWKAPDLIILAGRTSMGKTQIALHFAQSAAAAGKDVLFVSIEMTSTQLVNRLLLEDDRISAYNLATGQMSSQEWEAIDRRAAAIWNLKLHIADRPEIRYLDAICSEARRLKRKGELDMIVIDYLGLILIRGQKLERRQLEIARITGTLKSLAKELDVPLMLLSQLNRPEKGVAVKEPQLHDLRESGDIEQDADVVLFIHRPGYYDKDDIEWRNKGKIIIGKYREGARNNHVEFYHDASFKKIWGNEQELYMTQTNTIHPDRNVEPQEDSNPF